MRIIKLTPEFLIETLQGKAASFTSNLPDDIELLDIKYDLFSKQVYAIVRAPKPNLSPQQSPNLKLSLQRKLRPSQVKAQVQ